MSETSAPKTVLLIEDDRDICAAVIDILADEGFETIAVANGVEGLERLRSSGPRPFLIVLDLMLPVMDAWQFRSAQIADAAIADIPVVIFSADPKIAKHADELGAAGVIRKPPNLEEMLEIVMRFAGRLADGSAVA
ncbi:MAG: cheY [Myxococcales bacterium]|nr:cheY [Myxococcales bacterium]